VEAQRLKLKDSQGELQRLGLPQQLFQVETKVGAVVITEAQAKEYQAVHVAGLHYKAHAEQNCQR
jgi:hypothetical protein